MILQIQVESVSTRKDRTYKLVLGTQELSPKDATELFALNNSLAYCYISAKPIESDVIAEIDKASAALIDDKKSPSQLLRSVLYRNWEKNNDGFGSFVSFYDAKMHQITNHYKLKLDE